ncbi:hypothetical protein EDB80DRAFT_24817 [Ilyonectria destructans]|nr:hypothetical protein EDB80DRAFT_24817 [Ilyonectria destructans]
MRRQCQSPSRSRSRMALASRSRYAACPPTHLLPTPASNPIPISYTSLNLPAASGRRRLFIMATISASISTSAKRARHPQGPLTPVFHRMTHPSHLHRHRPAMIQGRIRPAHPCLALAPLGSPRLGPRRALVVSRNLVCFVPDARQKQALAVLSHCSGIPSRHSRLRGRASRCVASHRTPNPNNDRALGPRHAYVVPSASTGQTRLSHGRTQANSHTHTDVDSRGHLPIISSRLTLSRRSDILSSPSGCTVPRSVWAFSPPTNYDLFVNLPLQLSYCNKAGNQYPPNHPNASTLCLSLHPIRFLSSCPHTAPIASPLLAAAAARAPVVRHPNRRIKSSGWGTAPPATGVQSLKLPSKIPSLHPLSFPVLLVA